MNNYRDNNSQPPRHVYSMVITNALTTALTVKAVYQMPSDGHKEEMTTTCDANGTCNIPQKLVEAGSMTMTGHIEQLHVTSADGTVNLSKAAPFGTWSPKKDWPVTIDASGIVEPSKEANA